MKKKIVIAFLCFFVVVSVFANPQELYRQGLEYQTNEQWYSAIESYQAALKENSSYNLVYQGLAECFYALNEYDQALDFVKRARKYKQSDPNLQNLEGFILVGLGEITNAQQLFYSVLQRFPNNAEAHFGLAEIEVSQGKLFVASDIYKQALQRQGQNRKALLSLALISSEAGNFKLASNYIKKALEFHGDNSQVHYFAAYLNALSGDLETAEGRLYAAIKLKDDYDDAYALLASVLYTQKRYADVIKICDIRISRYRSLEDAWYLKALSLTKLNDTKNAILAAKIGLSINPENEIMRSLLEEIVIKNLDFEDKFRKELSQYHSDRGMGFLRRNMTAQALYEYRRALKVYPYDIVSRESYANILLRLGFPERYFEQMSFIQTISKSNKRVNDAVEAYSKILLSSIQTKWKIDSLYLDKAHISIGLFYSKEGKEVLHPESGRITAMMAADIFSHNSAFKINSNFDRAVSYKEAFGVSRKAGDDYFGIIRLRENDRDVQIILELFVSRTGSLAKTFVVSRSGNDRFSNSLRRLSKMLVNDVPVIGRVLNRYQNEAVVDIGKFTFEQLGITLKNGVPALEKAKIAILKKGEFVIKKDGLGFEYEPENLLGFFEPKKCDERLSEGVLSRNGYYDRMNAGDVVVFISDKGKNKDNDDDSSVASQDTFLYSLLRKIR